MRTEKLSGTLEEQCEFLYQLAQEKAAQGNYTGAVHVLKEIVKHVPDYKDAPNLLHDLQKKKAEQRNLLLMGLLGAALFTGIGTLIQVPNDLIFILLAIIGAVVGYIVGSLLLRDQQKRPQQNS